eukprot:117678-Pleurochrysis_carterae.AAC.2
MHSSAGYIRQCTSYKALLLMDTCKRNLNIAVHFVKTEFRISSTHSQAVRRCVAHVHSGARVACLLFDEFGEAFGQVGLVLGRHGGQRRRVDGGVLAVGGDERQFGHQQAVCRLEKVEQAWWRRRGGL